MSKMNQIGLAAAIIVCLSQPMQLLGNPMSTSSMTQATQNEKTVKVTVLDDVGPIPGASVFVKGTTNGAVTDLNGEAKIKASANSIIVVSFLGYVEQEVKLGNRSDVKVVLQEDTQELESTVVVGYGIQKKESLTSAISQINSKDITMSKQIDLVSSLQGKVPGLLIRQKNTKPGAFDTDLSVRGFGTPMIVIDGVVRSGTVFGKSGTSNSSATGSYNDVSALSEINPQDIESITVLKDASASIYGMGAENGVILITTKQGKAGQIQVSYNNNFSIGKYATPNDQVDWVTYMTWDNAMADVAKMSHKYSDELIQKYKNNDPSVTYFDWYHEYTKKYTTSQNHNFSIRGGSDRVTYYLSLGYADDNSMYKTDGYDYHRYNITANFNAKLTKNLSAKFTTTAKINDKSDPGGTSESQLSFYLLQTSPTIAPYTASGHISETPEHQNVAVLLDTYYNNCVTNGRAYNNTFDLTYDAPFLKGLKFSGTGAYDYSTSKTSTKVLQYDNYDYDTDEFVSASRTSSNYSEAWSENQRLYGKVQATYSQKWGKHSIQSTLAAEVTKSKSANIMAKRLYGATDDTSFYTHDTINSGLSTTATNSGTRTSSATGGYVGRLNYTYADKYIVELMGRYDGTYVYQRGKRFGLFPTYSLAWRLSEEKWIKNNLHFINNLKLRWSDGKTGSVQGSAYSYVGGYSTSGSWVFSDNTTVTGWDNTTIENTILTWADVRMQDFGIDWSLWDGKFGGSFDWYKKTTVGISGKRSDSMPDFLGVSLPSENLNSKEVQGLELELSHRNHIGEVNYKITGTLTYSRNKQTFIYSETTTNYTSSMNYWTNAKTNRWSNYNAASTYHWTGTQFDNLYQIADLSVLYSKTDGNRKLINGMYELVDRNGDGYIDSNDTYYTWADANPPLQFGLILSGSYKSFDVSISFSGAALKNKYVALHRYAGFGYLYSLPEHYTKDCYHVANYGDDPWDPQTEWVSGYWPALCKTLSTGENNNTSYCYYQPYNFVNASYLKLRTIELGYTVSQKLLHKVGIKSVRFFLNGNNLLTFCNKNLKYNDPEASDSGHAGGYLGPLKSINTGFNINF